MESSLLNCSGAKLGLGAFGMKSLSNSDEWTEIETIRCKRAFSIGYGNLKETIFKDNYCIAMVHTRITITSSRWHTSRRLICESTWSHHLWPLFLRKWLVRSLLLHWDHATKSLWCNKSLSLHLQWSFGYLVLEVWCGDGMTRPRHGCEPWVCDRYRGGTRAISESCTVLVCS